MEKKLIIFDLDGTLVDSSLDLCNAINYAIEPLGVSKVSVDDTKRLVGEGISRLIEKLVEENDVKSTKDDILERFLFYYNNHLLDNTRPYPNVIETLQVLNKYKKAVVTNKREDMSVNILKGLSMDNFFDFIVGSDTTGHKKPSPIPILYVLEKSNLRPNECIIVGDSNYDIQAGKSANVSTIAVTYGFRPLETLSDADYIINNFSDIVTILDKIEKI
ncbi:MAG: HAD-IA family hydrolase [Thermodesulfovibrionales bacterium]|nr:HAD-IA family hydrolase [Thermodesulfovibrionales bacterium]